MRVLPVPVVDMAVALVHEQDVVHLVFYVEGVRGHRLVQRKGVHAHVGVSQSFLRRQPVHGVKSQDLLQEVQSCDHRTVQLTNITLNNNKHLINLSM